MGIPESLNGRSSTHVSLQRINNRFRITVRNELLFIFIQWNPNLGGWAVREILYHPSQTDTVDSCPVCLVSLEDS
jgi:hypothetical protein